MKMLLILKMMKMRFKKIKIYKYKFQNKERLLKKKTKLQRLNNKVIKRKNHKEILNHKEIQIYKDQVE